MLWCRAFLVAAVWIGILPWAMRGIWRVLFWFADAGWAREAALEESWAWNSSEDVGPANRTLHWKHVTNYIREWRGASRNATSRDQPLMYKIITSILFGTTNIGSSHGFQHALNNTTAQNSTMHQLVQLKHSSVLSNVHWLQTLTPSMALNRRAMDVLEGLIITLSVILAFILIFLIREWVIQQQPMVGNIDDDVRRALEQAGVQVDVLPNGVAEPQDADGNEPELEHGRAEDVTDSEDDSDDATRVSIAYNRSASSSHVEDEHETDPAQAARPASGDLSAIEIAGSATHAALSELEEVHHEESSDSTTRILTPVSSSSSRDVSSDENHATSRPDMPPRGRSSLATAIIRDREERGPEESDDGVSRSSEGRKDTIANESSSATRRGKQRAIGDVSVDFHDHSLDRTPSLEEQFEGAIFDGENPNLRGAPGFPSGSSLHGPPSPLPSHWPQSEVLEGDGMRIDGASTSEIVREPTEGEIREAERHPITDQEAENTQSWPDAVHHFFWGEIEPAPEPEADEAEARGNGPTLSIHILFFSFLLRTGTGMEISTRQTSAPLERSHGARVHRTVAYHLPRHVMLCLSKR